MTASPSLGATIRSRRLELGLTQEGLAERISTDSEYVRQSDISRLERGEVELPRRARLERIAAALGLTTGELLACSGWARADECLANLDDRPSERAGVTTNDPSHGVVPLPALQELPDLTDLRAKVSELRTARRQLSDQLVRLAHNCDVFYGVYLRSAELAATTGARRTALPANGHRDGASRDDATGGLRGSFDRQPTKAAKRD